MDVKPANVTWFVEIMRTDDDVLDSLLNVIEWVHHNVAAVRAVTLGP